MSAIVESQNQIGGEVRKKRTTKKKKGQLVDQTKKRSTSTRPHTSQTYGKYVNEPNQLLPLQPRRQQRNLADARNHSFGAPANNNSRTSSIERSISAGAAPLQRKTSKNP
jgi:hypothetical protein